MNAPEIPYAYRMHPAIPDLIYVAQPAAPSENRLRSKWAQNVWFRFFEKSPILDPNPSVLIGHTAHGPPFLTFLPLQYSPARVRCYREAYP